MPGAPIPRMRLLFGPWPLAPVPLLVFGTIGFLTRAITAAGATPHGVRSFVLNLALFLLLGVITVALAVVAMLAVGGALRRRAHLTVVSSRTRYVVSCLTAAAVASSIQILVRYAADDPLASKGGYASIPLAWLVAMLTLSIFVFAATNTIGYFRLRLLEQTARLQDQLSQLGRQRTLIVEADQRVRNEVAAALHDDLQADLLRASLRLSRIADRSTPTDAEDIRTVVADLEQLRGEGVRAIGRRLAPPIASIGLASALEELAWTYAGSIDVAVDLEDAISVGMASEQGERSMAIYRIVEQALLNAAAHGRASQAWVSIRRSDGGLRVTIDDDGDGIAATITAGTGSAITDAWLDIFGGTWSLQPRVGGGAHLEVLLPAA